MMFQHVKGVLLALGIASVLLFLLSLLIPQQLVLTQEIVINQSQDSVYSYINDKKNIQNWMSDLKGLNLNVKNDHELIFKGRDEHLYRLEFLSANKAKGLEIQYFKEEEKKGVFVFYTKSQGNQTILTHQQFWNVGLNPVKKLLAFKSKKSTLEIIKKDLIQLKKTIENN